MSRRKPTAIKRLAGNPGKHPLNDDDLKMPSVSVISTPAFLSTEAKTEIRRVMKAVGKTPGLLASVDRAVLSMYAQGWAQWKLGEVHIAKEGPMITVTGQHGYCIEQLSPWVAFAKQGRDAMMQAAAKLGFDPVDRGNVHLIGAPKQQQADELTPPQWIPPQLLAEVKKKA